MQNKITLISFDNWNYDVNIINALKKKNIESHHINIGKYKHENIFERLKNTLLKIFLNKNLKHFKRQEFIINQLKKNGKQDQILVINPELIDKKYHLQIKTHTTRYVAYLYDSIARNPINHLKKDIFDEIYTFDKYDSEKYNFKKINNYIYLKHIKKEILNHKYKVVTICSFDKRFSLFNKIATQLTKMNYDYKFIFVSKNIFFKLHKYRQNNKYIFNSGNKFQSKKIELKQTIDFYKTSSIILDLVQNNQSGLSFRVFEALALNKKIITNNTAIKKYDFYNPNNILVIDENNLVLNKDFFTKPYYPIPEKIYDKYTIESWIENVFKLK